MSDTGFNPFNDRLSRDIRNKLSTSLTVCLNEMRIDPAEKVAASFEPESLPVHYQEYIDNRLHMYRIAVEKINDVGDDPISQAIILWDLRLFFEVHEVLEHAWLKADGDYKLILQALIRAAGAYIKKEVCATSPASRLADKAVTVLSEHSKFLVTYFEPDILLDALQDLSREPPKLSRK
jgi:uncharacterized protein